jgi:hypothetical protein
VTFSFNPAGVPSFEIKLLPTDHLYVKAMVESQERNPYITDPTGFAFHLGGPVLSTEIGYLKDPRALGQTTTMGVEPFTGDSDSGNHPGVYEFGAGYNPHKLLRSSNQRIKAGELPPLRPDRSSRVSHGGCRPERCRNIDALLHPQVVQASGLASSRALIVLVLFLAKGRVTTNIQEATKFHDAIEVSVISFGWILGRHARTVLVVLLRLE